MSRFYTGDSNTLETLKVELGNVKQSQTFNEKLAEQKRKLYFLPNMMIISRTSSTMVSTSINIFNNKPNQNTERIYPC